MAQTCHLVPPWDFRFSQEVLLPLSENRGGFTEKDAMGLIEKFLGSREVKHIEALKPFDYSPPEALLQFGLSTRVFFAFKRGGINTLDDLLGKTAAELLKIRTFGRVSLTGLLIYLQQYYPEEAKVLIADIEKRLGQTI